MQQSEWHAMPRVDSDIKLDFKDVLVRPKRSTLKSRSDVSSVLAALDPLCTDPLLHCRST